jgi:hypothetical protein
MRWSSDDQSSTAWFGQGVCAAVPDLAFTPALHVNYAEATLPMQDGLPKFSNLPDELGGSGETMQE